MFVLDSDRIMINGRFRIMCSYIMFFSRLVFSLKQLLKNCTEKFHSASLNKVWNWTYYRYTHFLNFSFFNFVLRKNSVFNKLILRKWTFNKKSYRYIISQVFKLINKKSCFVIVRTTFNLYIQTNFVFKW